MQVRLTNGLPSNWEKTPLLCQSGVQIQPNLTCIHLLEYLIY